MTKQETKTRMRACVSACIRVVVVTQLELKANGQLNLTFAEEKPVRKITRRAECRIEIRNHLTSLNGKLVHAIIDTSHLSAVEDVKAFGQQFELRVLLDCKPPRDAQVDVLDRRRMEEVVRQQRKPQRSIRAINAARRA